MNIEDLKTYITNYLEELALPLNYLSGLKVWIGISKHDDKVKHVKDIYIELFNTFNIEFLDCDITAIINSRKEYDALFLFAATPGVSARAIELVVTNEVDDNKTVEKEKMYIYMPKKYENGYIEKRLRDNLVTKSLFDKLDEDILKKSMRALINISSVKEKEMKTKFEPKILIVTALLKEFQAVKDLLLNPRYDESLGSEKSQFPHYKIKNMDTVLAKSGMGNSFSAAIATKMLSKYPSIEYIIMVGIAGGIPNTTNSEKHIRLGDIVISGEKGIIQHDMGKKTENGHLYNFNPRPPCATLLKNAEVIISDAGKNKFKFWDYCDKLLENDKDKYKRKEQQDLEDTPWFEDTNITLPDVPKGYNRDRPRVHIGSIASGNIVVKEASFREKLVEELPDIKALEMEASGLADASWLAGKDCFIVRGICDYCNPNKNKEWQENAAAVAAAFTIELIHTL